jgi:hypothetical protein
MEFWWGGSNARGNEPLIAVQGIDPDSDGLETQRGGVTERQP